MVKVIISGIGGQGTVSLGHMICMGLSDAGIEFVASETHGMAQRGGSVVFHLKTQEDAISPLIERGQADIIIAGEPMEALRVIDYLKDDGIVITATHTILSPVAKQMGLDYPDKEEIYTQIKQWPAQLFTVNTEEVAKLIGNAKVANVVLLGMLLRTNLLPISLEEITQIITKRWPKFADDNIAALTHGFEFDSLLLIKN